MTVRFRTMLGALVLAFLISIFANGDVYGQGSSEPIPGVVRLRLTTSAVEDSSFTLSDSIRVDTISGLDSLDDILRGKELTTIEARRYKPANSSLASSLGLDRDFWVYVADTADIDNLVADLQSLSVVELAFPVYPVEFLLADPNDSLYPGIWGHDNRGQMQADTSTSYDGDCITAGDPFEGDTVGDIGFDTDALAAWDLMGGYGDSNIIIAIIDQGVDLEHPDLRLVDGYDLADDDSIPDACLNAGHGTWCAGVAAARANNGIGVTGIAGGCSVMPIKVQDCQTPHDTQLPIEAGLLWAADHGADIASISLAMDGDSSEMQPMMDVVDYADSLGVTIFVATGNRNYNTYANPDKLFLVELSKVIGVGAASPCGERKRGGDDSLGVSCDSAWCWGSDYGDGMDFLAPTFIHTTDIVGDSGHTTGDYALWFPGTSASAPYAAGIAALILSVDSTLTPAEIRQLMQDGCTDVTGGAASAGYDIYSGYGMVNAYNSLPNVYAGTIRANKTWDSSPIHINGDLVIPDSVTLTIEAGVEVYIDEGDRLSSGSDANRVEIVVEGVLRIEGTSGSMVEFIGTGDSSWYGIRSTDSGQLIIDYANISNAKFGVKISTESADTIKNSWFENCSEYAIWNTSNNAVLSNDAFVITDTTFLTDSSYGSGVYFSSTGATASITDCYFENLFRGVYCHNAGPDITNCEFTWTSDTGGADCVAIDLYSSNGVDISGCEFNNYREGIRVRGISSSADVVECTFDSDSTTSGEPWMERGIYGSSASSGCEVRSSCFGVIASSAIKRDTLFSLDLGSSVVVKGDTITDSANNSFFETDDTTTLYPEHAIDNQNAGVVVAWGNWWDAPTGDVRDAWMFLGDSVIENDSLGSWNAECEVSGGEAKVVQAESGEAILPHKFSVRQNYPNPFNPATLIEFSLPAPSQVSILIYNILGQKVKMLMNRKMDAGAHEVTWNGKDEAGRSVSSGVYFYRIEAGDYVDAKKMILIK